MTVVASGRNQAGFGPLEKSWRAVSLKSVRIAERSPRRSAYRWDSLVGSPTWFTLHLCLACLRFETRSVPDGFPRATCVSALVSERLTGAKTRVQQQLKTWPTGSRRALPNQPRTSTLKNRYRCDDAKSTLEKTVPTPPIRGVRAFLGSVHSGDRSTVLAAFDGSGEVFRSLDLYPESPS